MSDVAFDRLYNTVIFGGLAIAMAALAFVSYDYYFNGPIKDRDGAVMVP